LKNNFIKVKETTPISLKKVVLLSIVFLSFLLDKEMLRANHLVGGELTYECLGGNSFLVNLIIYRDCNSTGAAFDDPAAIYLRDPLTGDYLTYQGFYRIPIDLPVDTLQLPIDLEGLCTDFIPNICVSRAIYSTVLELQPRVGGYEIVHQRCCRNTTILNIFNPGGTGSTYVTELPHESGGCDNSTPEFVNFPPLIICDGFPILFDHSATDADGDSLVYSLCRPSDGADENCPGSPLVDFFGDYLAPAFCFAIDPSNPSSILPISNGSSDNIVVNAIPSPIGLVDWVPGFGTDNALGNPIDPLTIDPQTGILTGTPNGEGQYVVGICVAEYRNGQLLTTRIRDFQFNVTGCNIIRAVPDADAEEIAPGVFQITNCDDFSVLFDNTSVNATNFSWDFGIDGISSDVSTDQFPVYIFPDTGTYTITLVATNGTACVDTGVLLLSLYPTFESDFAFDDQLCEYEPFQFNDMSQTTYGMVDTWFWDFGDGAITGPGSGPVTDLPNTGGTYDAPTHVFPEEGIYSVLMVSTNNLGCIDTVERVIEVLEQPEASIDFDFLCLDVPVNFSANTNSGTIVNYNWTFDGVVNSNGQQVQQLYNTPGDYFASLIVESDIGCEDTSLLNFTIYPPTLADAGLPQRMCFGDSVVLDASASSGGAGVNFNTYQWDPSEFVLDDSNSISPTVSPTSSQFFTVSVGDPNGCTDNAQVFVTVDQLPFVSAEIDSPYICFGDSSIQLQGDVAASVIDFSWSPIGFLSDATILNPLVYAADTTEFVLYGIDDRDCINTDTVVANVIPPVMPMLEASDVLICEGDSVQLNAFGGAEYIWSPPTGLSNPNISNPMASPSDDELYTITVANPPCFFEHITLSVSVNPLPFVDAGDGGMVNVGESIQLSGSSGGVSFEWSPGSSLSDSTILDPIAMPLMTTTYTLEVTSEEACKAIDSLVVNITNFFDLILPTAFTPNGDGQNDFLGLRTRGVEDLQRFIIYNRWGQKVFETNDVNESWDGTFNGKPQELGVYVFYVEGTKFLGGTISIKGNITLIR